MGGLWDWPDAIVAQRQTAVMAESVLHDVYIIADVTETLKVPGNAFAYIRALTTTTPSNIHKTILVGMNMFMRTIMQTFQKITPALGSHYGFAESREKARAMLPTLSSQV